MTKACYVVFLLWLLFGSVSVLAGEPKEGDYTVDFEVISASTGSYGCQMGLQNGSKVYEVLNKGMYGCQVFDIGRHLQGKFDDHGHRIGILWKDSKTMKLRNSEYQITQIVMVRGN